MANQVASTAICKCAFGAAPAPLTVPPAAKVTACGLPAACITDNKVPTFGMCSNPSNPAVASATAAAAGVLTPQPCTPAIAAPWAPGSPTVMIAGQPALNASCTLMCSYPGGVITITTPMANTVMVP